MIRARHVLDRWRSQSKHTGQARLGCDPGRARTGYDPVRQYRRREVDHRAGGATLRLYRAVACCVSPESAQGGKAALIMSNLLDTVMNIEVFAFIGLLLWLYFKQFKTDETENSDQ